MNYDTNNLKLTEPTDPRLDALLDEALAPEAVRGGIPSDLEARVLAAVQEQLARRRRVRAWFGPVRWSGAIAAVLFLAVGASLWFRANEQVTNSGRSTTHKGQVALAEAEKDLKKLSSYPGPSDAIDQDLLALRVEVDHAASGWSTAMGPVTSDDNADDWDSFSDADSSALF